MEVTLKRNLNSFNHSAPESGFVRILPHALFGCTISEFVTAQHLGAGNTILFLIKVRERGEGRKSGRILCLCLPFSQMNLFKNTEAST